MDDAANAAPYIGLISWALVGLIAGFIGSKIVNKSGEGLFFDMTLGVVGAVIGGYLFNAMGMQGATGLNLWSLVVALMGVVTLLGVYRIMIGVDV